MSKKFEEYLDDILKLKNDTACKLLEIAEKHNQSPYRAVQDYNVFINGLAAGTESLFAPLEEDRK